MQNDAQEDRLSPGFCAAKVTTTCENFLQILTKIVQIWSQIGCKMRKNTKNQQQCLLDSKCKEKGAESFFEGPLLAPHWGPQSVQKNEKMRPKRNLKLRRFSEGVRSSILDTIWGPGVPNLTKNLRFLIQNLFKNYTETICFFDSFLYTFLVECSVWFRF